MSNTVKQMAAEFVKGNGRKLAHRSVELCYPLGSPNEYRLHGNVIARLGEGDNIELDWCGWYGPTTANHMNAILAAQGIPNRVGYAAARKANQGRFTPIAF